MSIPQFLIDMDIIAKLDNEPNDTGGLSAAQLKAKFDEGGNALKNYLNNTLIPALEKLIGSGGSGTDGENGTNGENGSSGKDGFSPIVSLTKVGGVTTLEITDADGTEFVQIYDGEDGVDGADGKDGEDGYTPVKGIDYFTPTDKEEMVALVLAALPTATGVSF